MLKIGLTGSIGMGKSTVAKAFEDLGIKTWSADKAVHEIYSNNDSLKSDLVFEFGDILDESRYIDRKKLGNIVLSDATKLRKLEKIIHPLVAQHRKDFIKKTRELDLPYIILDIPLLYETKSQNDFDKIIVVNCSPETQRERVMARPNMTIEKFDAIVSQQIKNSEKASKADYIINTEKSLDETIIDIQQLHDKLLDLAGEK